MGDSRQNRVPKSVEHSLNTVERLRAPELFVHETIVGTLSAALCGLLGLEPGYAEHLQAAAALHDIGKIVLPDRILNKPSRLDADEWTLMRSHARYGYEILQGGDHPDTELAASIALHHHECWDGSGYPDGLSGDMIPPEARIVGLCDVYDALREARPYKPALSHEQALHIILVGDGRTRPEKFDPTLLAVLTDAPELFRVLYDGAMRRVGAVN